MLCVTWPTSHDTPETSFRGNQSNINMTSTVDRGLILMKDDIIIISIIREYLPSIRTHKVRDSDRILGFIASLRGCYKQSILV